MTAVWQAGKTYVPGSLVKPSTSSVVVQSDITNGDFSTGDLTGWDTPDPGKWSVITFDPYSGTYCGRASGGGISSLTNTVRSLVAPGQKITVKGQVKLTNSGTDDQGGQINLVWYDSSNVMIGSPVDGNLIFGSGGFWKLSTVTGAAPAGATYASVQLGVNTGSHGGTVEFDNITWQYAYQAPTAGIIYKATQAAPGKSGSSEPTWPGVVGVPVTDNEVTWEGEIATRVVWQASPLAKSGATEPTWPATAGASVHDGTIDWISQSAQITDPNCPQSKYVVIAASKVYAADKDIIRYCATVNPLDWTSNNDAGYLPYGLQDYGSNPCVALGLYRSNLVAFNAEGFQMWQVDPDPASMALLDALPVATEHHRALAPTSNDLFFLASEGVRSMGISSAGVNLEAGDVGMPIDDMVQAALDEAESTGTEPIGTFIPSMGQYWLAFPPARPLIVGSLPDTCDDKDYDEPLTITRGTSPYSNLQVVSGTPPTGATFPIVGSTISVQFSDASASDYVFFITVDDATGLTSLAFQCSITVRHFEITGSLPDGAEGTAYSEPLTLSGGVAQFDAPVITSGSMPAGGTLSISGDTLTVAWPDTAAADTYDFDFSVTDANGCAATYSASVTVGETFMGAVLFDSPIFYLPLNETSGTVANDITGNGHDGTYTGTYTHSTTELIAGDHSLGVGASSSRGRVSVPDGAYGAVFTTDHWTLIALAKSASLAPLPGGIPTICAKFYSPTFGHVSGAINFRDVPSRIVGSYTDTVSNTAVASYPWTNITTPFMVMVVRDWNPATGITLSLYINGSLVSTKMDASNSLGVTTSLFPFEIGGDGSFPDSYQWWGNIGHVALFDKSISAARALKYAQLAGYA